MAAGSPACRCLLGSIPICGSWSDQLLSGGHVCLSFSHPWGLGFPPCGLIRHFPPSVVCCLALIGFWSSLRMMGEKKSNTRFSLGYPFARHIYSTNNRMAVLDTAAGTRTALRVNGLVGTSKGCGQGSISRKGKRGGDHLLSAVLVCPRTPRPLRKVMTSRGGDVVEAEAVVLRSGRLAGVVGADPAGVVE